MKFMSASEANRNFSAILGMATGGEEIIITSHGKPVAMIGPLTRGEEKRAAARAKLFKRLNSQKPNGIPIDWTRDDLYEADF